PHLNGPLETRNSAAVVITDGTGDAQRDILAVAADARPGAEPEYDRRTLRRRVDPGAELPRARRHRAARTLPVRGAGREADRRQEGGCARGEREHPTSHVSLRSVLR